MSVWGQGSRGTVGGGAGGKSQMAKGKFANLSGAGAGTAVGDTDGVRMGRPLPVVQPFRLYGGRARFTVQSEQFTIDIRAGSVPRGSAGFDAVRSAAAGVGVVSSSASHARHWRRRQNSTTPVARTRHQPLPTPARLLNFQAVPSLAPPGVAFHICSVFPVIAAHVHPPFVGLIFVFCRRTSPFHVLLGPSSEFSKAQFRSARRHGVRWLSGWRGLRRWFGPRF